MTSSGLSRTLAALNAEWADLEHRPAPPGWLPGLVLGPDASLGDVLARVRAEPDAVLLALLRAQHEGDQLAGRLVVQAMVPKLVRMTIRDDAAGFDDYLAALWVRVATYPVARRPRRVAANLALDALKTVKAGRPGPVRALPTTVPDPLADAASVLDAGVRLGAIDDVTHRTLAAVYVDGRTSRAAAETLGVSADAVRWRCSKGVRALRAVAPELVHQLAG